MYSGREPINIVSVIVQTVRHSMHSVSKPASGVRDLVHIGSKRVHISGDRYASTAYTPALAASAHTTQSLAHSSPVLRFGRSAAGLLGPDAITEIAVVVTRPPHGRLMEEAYEGQNS
jgi:hypothetical protein